MTDIQSNVAKLGTEPVSKLLLSYSIPAVIAMIVSSLYNIVDRIFIGQGVGPLAISGLTLTFPVMTLVTAIGTLIGVGASTRISIVLGMKDMPWARNILGNALFLTFIMSAVLVVPMLIWLKEILEFFGGTENNIPYAVEYLRIVIPGSVLMNLSFGFSGLMRASGYPTKSMVTILIGMILNVILDPIFIFWLYMGIKGAAVATIISMFVSAVFVMTHFFDKRSYVHFEKGSFRLKKQIIRNIISIGLAPFLMNVTASTVIILLARQLTRYGNDLSVENGGELAVGAYGIINSYSILAVMCVMGICQGMQPIVGYNYGARKLKRVREVLILSIKVATVIVTVAFAIGQIFPYFMASAFTTDPTLREITRDGLRIVFAVFPLIGVQIVTTHFYQSISRAKEAIFMSLSRQILFLIPFMLIFGRMWGLHGVWLSIPASDFLSVLVAFYFLWYAKKKFYPDSAARLKMRINK